MRLTNHLRCLMKEVAELTKQYSNLPDRYIKRAGEKILYKTPERPEYLQKEVKRKFYKFGLHRPWTQEFEAENDGLRGNKTIVEPIKDWLIFRGDRVEVLVGLDKGKQGIVSQIIQERNWVIVQGLHWKYKTMAEKGDFPGMVIRDERPLLATTEVALVDPADNKRTKVEWRYTEDGEKVRVSLRTGRLVPMPIMAEETYDYKTKETYVENVKDTTAKLVEQPTFEPKLKTFEMEIMDAMGIVETRRPKKSYWY